VVVTLRVTTCPYAEREDIEKCQLPKEGRGMSSSADERRPILRLGQILLLILAPGTILVLYAVLFLTLRYGRYVIPVTDFFDVLWQTAAGIEMVALALLLIPIGELILVVQFIICNRLRATWRPSLLVGLTLLVLATCFAPAVLVLLVGPPIAEERRQRGGPTTILPGGSED
jgi:hypothetical protein